MAFCKHEKSKSKSDHWLTPMNIIEALGPFDLDPCGHLIHTTASTIYTENGLEQNWFGKVWLNPPYSEVETWLSKLADHGNGIALVFARMDTKWAQGIIPKASSVFFPKGRIAFLNLELEKRDNAGAASMFLAFGDIPKWSKLGQGLVYNPAQE